MRRRDFIAIAVGSGTAVFTFPVFAQSRLPVVGYLHSATPTANQRRVQSFLEGLSSEGFHDNVNVKIDYRWASNRFDDLPRLARDLASTPVDVIFAGGGEVSAIAAKSATATIPIVFAIGADPISNGLVTSLGRPGGNITGATVLTVELRPKLVELFREFVPNASSIAVLGNPDRPGFGQLINAVLQPARSAGLRTEVLRARNESEIEEAFSKVKQLHVAGMVVLSDPIYLDRREKLAELEISYKVPALHSSRAYVEAGSLASYGASFEEAYREAGAYVGRILKGAKPADLPVLQPTKLELIINARTAKFLDLQIPPTLLARADEVIE